MKAVSLEYLFKLAGLYERRSAYISWGETYKDIDNDIRDLLVKAETVAFDVSNNDDSTHDSYVGECAVCGKYRCISSDNLCEECTERIVEKYNKYW